MKAGAAFQAAKRRPDQLDYRLLGAVLLLVGLGLVMLFSASGIWADQRLHDPLFYLKKQLVWAGLGLAAMLGVSRVDYNRLKEWTWPIFVISAVSLVAVLFAQPEGGARRWFHLGPMRFQPAEFAKLAMVLFLADYVDRKRSKVDSPVQGMLVPWAAAGLLMGLIAAEPDIGTPALMFATAAAMLFIGGANLRYLAAGVVLALPVLAYELLRLDYRRHRLAGFLQTVMDPQAGGQQVANALMAVGSGGWFGRGVGASQLKLMYIPAPHTDFIFPIIAEEVGLVGSAAVLAAFAYFLGRGIRVARNAPNLYGTLLAAGISLGLSLQAFINISMSVGILPTKGMPLPFVSYGGSSLLLTLASVGILLSVSRQAR